MWYIEKVWVRDVASVPIECVSLIRSRFDNAMGFVVVWLRNSETRELVKLSSEGSYKDFERALEPYTPYGHVPPRVFNDGTTSFSTLFVEIDDLSVKFLDCVDKVVVLDCERGSAEFDFVEALKHWVTVWDVDGTILELCSASGDYACSLFQIMCFFEESGWKGDRFYMRGKQPGSGVRVEFSDVHKARAMLAKAALVGYDPLNERMKEDLWG